jgi:hypothetical protein
VTAGNQLAACAFNSDSNITTGVFVRESVIRAFTPKPGANSTTESCDVMANSPSNRCVSSNPPGLCTRLPIQANNQWPGIFSTGDL